MVRIGRDCWIGMTCNIFNDIGDGCVIASGSVVVDPIPPYSIAAGNPAKVIRSRRRTDDAAKAQEPGPEGNAALHNTTFPEKPPSLSGQKVETKPVVMQLLVSLDMGGAERLALSILDKNKKHFSGIIAGLFQEPGLLANSAAALDLPCVALAAHNCGKIEAVLRLYKALRQHRVSLLHIQAAYLVQFALPAAIMARVPIVYTEHALHSLRSYPRLRWILRLGAPFLRGITCVNQEVADYFRDTLQIPANRITVICNGVDVERFSPSVTPAPLPWSSVPDAPCFVFGTVSRLTEAKDHPNLLRAFSLVAQRHSEARLLLVGDGEERAAIQTLIQNLNITEKVYITGMCHDIPERLRSMDVFVLSSKREGLPMALLEAMACGLPVISTDVGGIAKINDNPNRLLLVPGEDSDALASAMEKLLTNNEKRNHLARQGHDYILATATDKIMADAYYRLYLKGGLPCV